MAKQELHGDEPLRVWIITIHFFPSSIPFVWLCMYCACLFVCTSRCMRVCKHVQAREELWVFFLWKTTCLLKNIYMFFFFNVYFVFKAVSHWNLEFSGLDEAGCPVNPNYSPISISPIQELQACTILCASDLKEDGVNKELLDNSSYHWSKFRNGWGACV